MESYVQFVKTVYRWVHLFINGTNYLSFADCPSVDSAVLRLGSTILKLDACMYSPLSYIKRDVFDRVNILRKIRIKQIDTVTRPYQC